MNDALTVVVTIIVGVFTFFVIAATFLRLACWFCRVEIPWYSHAIWIVFLDTFACALIATIGGRVVDHLAIGVNPGNMLWLHVLMFIILVPFNMVVSAYVYTLMIPTDFVKGLLIKAAHNTIWVVAGVGIFLLLPPNITQEYARRRAANPGDPLAIRDYMGQMRAQWKTAVTTLRTSPLQHQAGAQPEAARSDGTLVSSNPKWRLLEIKDIGIALTKEGMPGKATSGRFVLVTYQGTSGAASSHVMYFPTLVDSQDRQFKPISESPLYLPKGQRFMTVTRLSSDVTETFHSIYEVAADSQGLHFQGQRPPEGFEKKTPL